MDRMGGLFFFRPALFRSPPPFWLDHEKCTRSMIRSACMFVDPVCLFVCLSVSIHYPPLFLSCRLGRGTRIDNVLDASKTLAKWRSGLLACDGAETASR